MPLLAVDCIEHRRNTVGPSLVSYLEGAPCTLQGVFKCLQERTGVSLLLVCRVQGWRNHERWQHDCRCQLQYVVPPAALPRLQLWLLGVQLPWLVLLPWLGHTVGAGTNLQSASAYTLLSAWQRPAGHTVATARKNEGNQSRQDQVLTQWIAAYSCTVHYMLHSAVTVNFSTDCNYH